MVALKNDLIWCRVSSFHLPFTPFELGSGMRLDGVHRTETIELGLLNEGGQPALSSINFDFENELRASIEMWLRKGEEE